jgi:hypothetical protein
MEASSLAPIAQPGDICLLLVPDSQELERLREHLLNLQAAYGGEIVENLHVTCQRFRPDNAAHLAHITAGLVSELSSVKPFSLTPGSVITFRSEFWQSSVARWAVQTSPAWKSFLYGIDRILLEMSCAPHYPADKIPTCTALEDISMDETAHEKPKLVLPEALFEARKVLFSRIDGPGKFTIQKVAYLGTA